MKRPFVLINSNVVRPPVNPLGLEYVGEFLLAAGVEVQVVDLAWEQDWRSAIGTSLSACDPLAIGIAFRNLDDCSSVTRTCFVPWLEELIREVRCHASCAVVLGGVGFSIAPAAILEASGADLGIAGDGEQSALALAQCLLQGRDPSDLPNLVYRRAEAVACNPLRHVDLGLVPTPSRRLFDNSRYQAEGAMVGIETKRGCPQGCIYCADPLSKGEQQRLRPPKSVVQEMSCLVERGVGWYHVCDSEFNIPLSHAKEVCRAILESRLEEKIRWYTYCAPVPFDAELAELMHKSGCAGINFGVDSLCDQQLERLNRNHRIRDIEELVRLLRVAGLNFMFDLLLGGVGETERTLRAGAEACRRLELPLVGVAEGMRVYPGTPLFRELQRDTSYNLIDPLEPSFYFSPALGPDPVAAIRKVLGDDPRYLLLARSGQERNYNYVGDSRLQEAIAKGARGAYWDIIRKSHD